MTNLQKEHFMALALAISKNALPACRPNPPVGCVLVKQNKVVGKGFTQPPGNDHAEAMALRQYAGSLEAVSVFVTLEPCSYHGRTPSCARALIDRGAKAVFVSILDPHPKNRGEGIRMLRNAGIRVEVGLLAGPIMDFLHPYLIYP